MTKVRLFTPTIGGRVFSIQYRTLIKNIRSIMQCVSFIFQIDSMGNKQAKKIIILDERHMSEGSNYRILIENQYKIEPVIYSTWNEFTQKQAIQDITEIIVRYYVKDKKSDHKNRSADKPRQEKDSTPSQKQRKNSFKLIEDNIMTFVSNQYGPQQEQKRTFTDVCPLLDITHLGSLKDKLISHVKKYAIKINIYLFADKAQNVKLMHYEKPYIKLISDNLEEIIKSIRQDEHRVQVETKSNRMFEGLYRRMVVKVLDEYYEEKQKPKEAKKKEIKQPKKKVDKSSNTLKDLIKKLQDQSNTKNMVKNNKSQQQRLDQQVRIFEKYKIQPQFFNTIDLFQKSFISTTCQYVICSESNLLNIIDCKIKCDQQYKIIVKEDMIDSMDASNDRLMMSMEMSTRVEHKANQNQSLNVWFRHHSLDEILKKILSYTEITNEEAPVLSSNIIICGNDPIFKTLAFKNDNENQLKKLIKKFLISSKDELKNQLVKNFKSRRTEVYYEEKAKRIEQKFKFENRQKIQGFQIIDKLFKYESSEATNKIITKIKEIDEKQLDAKIIKLAEEIEIAEKCQITLVKGDNLQQNLLPQLKKSMYSYLVIFTQDDFLEDVKKFLRQNNFHQRVQLTSVMQKQKYDYTRMSQKEKQRIYEQKLHYLISKKVPYLIKFEVGPIVSIHLYKPSESLLSYFNDKIGLKAFKIESMQEFKSNYMEPTYNKIIQSKRLVCNVEHYCKQIKPVIQEIRKLGLKIIIFDEDRMKILELAKSKSNFEPEIEYVDCEKLRIQNFVLLCKSPSVSIPFFRTSVLTEFVKESKQIEKYKSSYSLALESSVFSSNQTIKQILGGNYLGLNTQYSTGFTVFSRQDYQCEKEIKKFEQNYLKSYVRLWYFGYGIIKSQLQIQKHKDPQRKNTDQVEIDQEIVTYSTELSLLKQQICYLFYKCKSYDLLNVSENDFKQFYIQRVQNCSDFLDLQIACIYILSLPHGFNNVVSDLFKNPKISKIAIKIFVVYLVVLLSAYYDFRNQEEETIKILTYLNNQSKLNKQIKNLKEGDTVFTEDFVFCIDTKKQNINIEQEQSHHIIFKFDSIHVLEKSKIKPYINIEKYSFYKEGPEYVIPPFTKFMVSHVRTYGNGIYEIELRNITERQKSFPYLILNENNLTENLLFNTFNSEKGEKPIIPYVDKISMYKRTQTANIIRNKEDLLQEFKKSKNHNLFFQAKILQKYMTCNMYLTKQKKQLEVQLQKALNSEEVNKQKEILKIFGIQRAFLYYHFQEYALSIDVLMKIKQIMDDQGQINQRQQWKRVKTEKIMCAVENTFQKRASQIMSYPKKKYWKVSLKTTKVQKTQKLPAFVIKSRSEQWQNSYNEQFEIFPLTYINCMYQKEKNNPQIETQNEKYNLLKKDLSQNVLVPSDSPNQFGSSAISEINSKIFGYLSQYTKSKRTDVAEQQQYNDEDDEKYVEEQNVGDPFEKLLNFKTDNVENWVVFYLGSEVKVVNKKKRHYHMKLNPCSHQHKQSKNKIIKRTENVQQKTGKDKFKVQNKNEQIPRYHIPNDGIGSHVCDEHFVLNIDDFTE